MQIFYKEGTRRVSYIKTSIKSEDLVDEKGRDKLANLLRYYVEEFITNLELYKADELISYAKENDIDISNAFVLEHKDGKALCNISQYINKITVKPFISIDSVDLLRGWTFETGHFSDVDIYLNVDSYNMEYMSVSCTDVLSAHELFLHWVFSHLEKDFYSNKEFKTYEKTKNCFNKNSITYYPYDDYRKFEFLSSIVEVLVNKNKSIRMDRLNINGITPLDYIKENHIFKYVNSESDIFKMCIYFGKPYKQVRTYIENHSPF